MRTTLSPARILWQEERPVSAEFRDIYHAKDGPGEVRRVFVAPSRLAQRFEQGPFDSFTIAELGFGSGLSFAVIAELFLATAPPGRRLHFISFEKHPFAEQDMRRAARRQGRALPLHASLAACYPPLLPGWHRRHFADGRIALTLFLGEVSSGLAELERSPQRAVDAWLLDGFAPERNPAMWAAELFARLAALSRRGTTVATFTAAGRVRRDLTRAGFEMSRIDQRPHKRHSLAGRFAGAPSARSAGARVTPARMTVIGAGLAGCATARQLAERGVEVELYEAGAEPRNAPPAALLHPRLSAGHDAALAAWRAMSYAYARHWHGRFMPEPASGVLQLPAHPGQRPSPETLEAIAARYEDGGGWLRAVSAGEASELAGIPLRQAGLHFPDGAALDVAALCTRLRQHPAIRYHGGRAIELRPNGEAWRLNAPDTAAVSPATPDAPAVLCTGAALADDPTLAAALELGAVWGQLDLMRLAPAPALPLIGEGYIADLAPAGAVSHGGTLRAVGASYEYRPWTAPRATRFNCERLTAWWRRICDAPLTMHPQGHWRGVRAVTSDRLPVIGALYDDTEQALPALRVNLGHGSSGMTSIPLAAEALASELCGEVAPLGSEIATLLGALRFRRRQRRRGTRQGVPGARSRR